MMSVRAAQVATSVVLIVGSFTVWKYIRDIRHSAIDAKWDDVGSSLQRLTQKVEKLELRNAEAKAAQEAAVKAVKAEAEAAQQAAVKASWAELEAAQEAAVKAARATIENQSPKEKGADKDAAASLAPTTATSSPSAHQTSGERPARAQSGLCSSDCTLVCCLLWQLYLVLHLIFLHQGVHEWMRLRQGRGSSTFPAVSVPDMHLRSALCRTLNTIQKSYVVLCQMLGSLPCSSLETQLHVTCSLQQFLLCCHPYQHKTPLCRNQHTKHWNITAGVTDTITCGPRVLQ